MKFLQIKITIFILLNETLEIDITNKMSKKAYMCMIFCLVSQSKKSLTFSVEPLVMKQIKKIMKQS